MERLFTLGLTNAAIATVLALAVTLLSRRLRQRPGWLHCLWLLVLMKLVTPPLFELPVLRTVRPEPVLTLVDTPQDIPVDPPVTLEASPSESVSITLAADLAERPPAASFRTLPILEAAWLVGSVIVLVLAGVRVARFRRLLRLAEPADDDVQDLVSDLAARMGLSRAPVAWTVDAPLPPLLWAVDGPPRLILPSHLWKRLDDRQRKLLLVHELAHLKRGDHLVRLFELGVTAAFWWLPTVWWARKALRDAEEDCCDAWVVWAFPDDARDYAETLLDTVDFLTPPRPAVPLLASGFGGTHHLQLQRRLTMIMQGTTPRRMGLAGTLGAFGLSACLLPINPGWAQPPFETRSDQSISVTVTDDDAKPGKEAKVETKVGVAIAVDGEVEEVKADSVAKAVESLRHRIDELAKDKDSSVRHEAQIKTLKQAIAGLENAKVGTFVIKKLDGLDGHAKATEEKRSVIVLRAKADPKDQAKIEKAKARIAAIHQDLARKQKELDEAHRELAKLAGEPRIIVGEPAVPIEVVGKPLFKAQGQQFRVEVKEARAKDRFDVELKEARIDSKDRDRLVALEKKLSELLKEVEGLRKQREHKPEAK